jgi:pyruvate dehydrogenase (quinone)/pyruvate oxidase
VRFVQVRHEEAAAFMACGYAKLTGRLGCCLATYGPGGVHLLNGLYDAKLDGVPVVALTGMQLHDLIHTHTQQDVELDKLFMDVAVYNTRVMSPTHVRNVTELACRNALSRRGVAHVSMPVDLQSEAVQEGDASKRNVPGHNVSLWARDARRPAAAAQTQRGPRLLGKGPAGHGTLERPHGGAGQPAGHADETAGGGLGAG